MRGFKKIKVKMEVREYVPGEDLEGIQSPTGLITKGKIIRDPSDYSRQFFMSDEDYLKYYGSKEERSLQCLEKK